MQTPRSWRGVAPVACPRWLERHARRPGADGAAPDGAGAREAERRQPVVLLPQWTPDGRVHPSEEVLASFVDRNDIVDDGGKPLKLVLVRLRKTHKAEWYRRTNGQMEQFAIGHTAEVAANHYADIPALRALHEETVAAGLQDALDVALIPRVVPPEAEALMRNAPESADLPVPPDEVIAFLDGSRTSRLPAAAVSMPALSATRGILAQSRFGAASTAATP